MWALIIRNLNDNTNEPVYINKCLPNQLQTYKQIIKEPQKNDKKNNRRYRI